MREAIGTRGMVPAPGGVAEWLRQGPAKPCTRVRFPPPPRAISSVGEHFLDTEEATGSIPVSPTSRNGPAPDQVRGRFPSERPRMPDDRPRLHFARAET